MRLTIEAQAFEQDRFECDYLNRNLAKGQTAELELCDYCGYEARRELLASLYAQAQTAHENGGHAEQDCLVCRAHRIVSETTPPCGREYWRLVDEKVLELDDELTAKVWALQHP